MDSWDLALERIDHVFWSVTAQIEGLNTALEELKRLMDELDDYSPPEYEEAETAERILEAVTREVSRIGMDADTFASSIRSASVNVRREMR